jgi:hypothetical protein
MLPHSFTGRQFQFLVAPENKVQSEIIFASPRL